MFEPSEGHHIPDEGPLGDDLDPNAVPRGAYGPQGNRPADGASVGSPDDLSAAGDWSGASAGDFLGLGDASSPHAEAYVDEGAEIEPEAAWVETTSALADAPELEEGDFEGWLEDEDEDSASWLMELDDDSGSDAFDPERLEAEFGVQTGRTGPLRGGWILRLGLVAAGLGVGFLGSRWYGDHFGGGTADDPIARIETPYTAPAEKAPTAGAPNGGATRGGAPRATGAERPGSQDADAVTTNTNTKPDRPGAAPQGAAKDGDASATTARTTLDSTSRGAPQSAAPKTDAPPGGSAARPGTDTDPDPLGGPFAAAPGTEGSAPGTPFAGGERAPSGEGTAPREGRPNSPDGKAFTMPVEDMVVVPRVENGPVAYASAEEMAMMWTRKEIPLDRIHDADRLLTPRVGRVRLAIHGGEIFEGRLYAVGENRVWLDTGTGKMALMGWQVDRIEHLPDVAAPTPGEKGSENLGGLPRVRVRTPGGVFYGKLLDEHEGEVTLITEGGGRLRLSNARVEPAGKSRTRIVDPGGAQPQEATSKGKQD